MLSFEEAGDGLEPSWSTALAVLGRQLDGRQIGRKTTVDGDNIASGVFASFTSSSRFKRWVQSVLGAEDGVYAAAPFGIWLARTDSRLGDDTSPTTFYHTILTENKTG